MIERSLLLIVAVLATACGSGSKPLASAPSSGPDRTTVPLFVETNRPVVEVTFLKEDGSTRKARFVVDSGGGGFLIVGPLARELGLELGETMSEGNTVFAHVKSKVAASIGSVALALQPDRVLVLPKAENMLPPASHVRAEGLLPGHVLARYHVVLDYPKGTFTIAKPGALVSAGPSLPMPVAERSGFPRTEIEVDGKTYGFLLDTGASFTMVSQALLESWGAVHPEWERHPGAYGAAATLGGQTNETMIVPEVSWAGRRLAGVGVTSQDTGTFEEMISSSMTAPVVGSLAGNVLKRFRVDLDYPNQKLYLTGP